MTMKVIFIFAHPDDETFSSGGTIALLTKRGVEVKLITATRGEKGQLGDPPICEGEELGKVREKELRKAAKVLGISRIYFLHFIDGSLSRLPKNQISNKILKVFIKENPDIVITFNEEGGSLHPDHIQISESATDAFKKYLKIAKKHVRLYYSAMPRSFVEKLRSEGLDYRVFGKIKGTSDSEITTVIDISDTIDIKVKALKCHKTQKKDWERFIKRLKHKETRNEFFSLIKENNLI